MTTKPKAKSETSSKTSDSTTTTGDAGKSESAGASSETKAKSGGSSSASSRPISYFSSVSSDDYRSGWDQIFKSGKKSAGKGKAKRAAPKRAKVNPLPLSITLDADDLDAAAREQIEAVLRQQAKKKRLNFDKLNGNGQVSWHIACRISDN